DEPESPPVAVPEIATPVIRPEPRPVAAPPAVAEAPPAPAATRVESCLPVPEREVVRGVLAEYTGPLRRSFGNALRRGEKYLPMIREALSAEGVPEELAYLALVESHFVPEARSPAGAVGMWQFIESTARLSGLRVDWWVDERLDPEAATRAAARHLKELYAQFGDWDLSLAAYNAGPGGVGRALSRNDADGFWTLLDAGALRAETSRYVPKFYAALTVARDPAAHGFDLGVAAEALPRFDRIRVDSPVDLATVARLAGVENRAVAELNPALLRNCTPPGEASYPLRLPAGTGQAVAVGLASIPPAERLAFRRHRVRPGESLATLSQRYGAPPGALAQLNGLAATGRLRAGAELVVPVAEGLKDRRAVVDEKKSPRVYVVQSGDTASGIARRHGVSTDELLRWNGMDRKSILRPGERFVLGPVAGERLAAARFHVVREGETLWGISRRYGVSLEDLQRRNDLPAGAVLRPGDRLVLGAGEGDPS
ncbi:MAG: lytic transglycosylase domain-containing protein, partial [Deferrisomatales bacterium]